MTMKMKKTATMTRKEAAISFLRLAAGGDVHAAYDAYIAPGFHHHNPYFRSDGESLMRGMEEAHEKNPRTSIEVQRAIEERDLVAVHSRVRMKPDEPGVAVVHIFRFDVDRIVELWDIGQQVPEKSPNTSGMF